MSDGLIFEDPGPVTFKRQSKLFTDEFLASLREHPGKWVVLLTSASSSQVTNASSWARRHEDEGYEVRSRLYDREAEDPYRVYARYVG